MIVIQVILALLILTGLTVGAYNIGIGVGREFTKQFPGDEEPEIYRRGKRNDETTERERSNSATPAHVELDCR